MIPEPEDPLWFEVKTLVSWAWPQADEDAADRLAQAWRAAADSVDQAARQSGEAASAVSDAWRDTAGLKFVASLRRVVSGDDGLHALAAAMRQLAGDVQNYANAIRDLKNGIRNEIALNAALFAATFALPPVLGDAFRGGIVRRTAARIARLVNEIAGSLKHTGLATVPKPFLRRQAKDMVTEIVEEA